MGPAPALKYIEPRINCEENDDFVYPTDEQADQYNAAFEAHSHAVQAQLRADDHSTLCWRGKNTCDRQRRSLEQTARRSKTELEEIRASIPRLDEATRECEDMLACVREVLPKACSRLAKKRTALARAEAGCEIDGKRKRSTARNHGTISSKSIKVGDESAGKAARAGQPLSVLMPAACEPDAPAEKRLDKLRVGVETAEKDVKKAKGSVDEVLHLLEDHRRRAAGERTREELLTRVAADDAQASHAFAISPCYREACEAYHHAGVRLEEAKTTAIRAEGALRAAEVVFREALAAGKWVVAPSQRVETAKTEITSKKVIQHGGECYPRYDGLVVPEPTASVRLPVLKGIHGISETKMCVMLAEEDGRRERAKARRQANDIKVGVKVKKEKKKRGQKKGKARRQTNKATPAVGSATVRRSARSSRGKPAEVYDA